MNNHLRDFYKLSLALIGFFGLSTGSMAYNDHLDRAIARSQEAAQQPLQSDAWAKARIVQHLAKAGLPDSQVMALVETMDASIVNLVRQGHHPVDLGIKITPPAPTAASAPSPTPSAMPANTNTATHPDKKNQWVSMGVK